MYSGAFTTNSSQNHNLFYWFFKNTELSDLPLVVYLNGGPGSSSVTSIFLENGPLRLNKTGESEDDWVIYVD
jgi:carboxypeptidase C (cathepsin A)